MKDIEKYLTMGSQINFESNNMIKVFTPETGSFCVMSLDELTPERFEFEISRRLTYEIA